MYKTCLTNLLIGTIKSSRLQELKFIWSFTFRPFFGTPCRVNSQVRNSIQLYCTVFRFTNSRSTNHHYLGIIDSMSCIPKAVAVIHCKSSNKTNPRTCLVALACVSMANGYNPTIIAYATTHKNKVVLHNSKGIWRLVGAGHTPQEIGFGCPGGGASGLER